MKMIYILIVCLLFSAFAKAQDSTTVNVPRIVVKAYLGATVPVENMEVKLLEVIEDSRCPQDVQCVWAGRAKVLVQLIDTTGENTQKEVVFSGGNVTSLYNENGVEIVLRGLAPYPNASSKIDPKNYYLLMDVRVQ